MKENDKLSLTIDYYTSIPLRVSYITEGWAFLVEENNTLYQTYKLDMKTQKLYKFVGDGWDTIPNTLQQPNVYEYTKPSYSVYLNGIELNSHWYDENEEDN